MRRARKQPVLNWQKVEAIGPFVIECQHKLTGIRSYLAKGGGITEGLDAAEQYPTLPHAQREILGMKKPVEHEFTIMPRPNTPRYPAEVWAVVKQLTVAGIEIAEVEVSATPEMYDHEIAVSERQLVQIPVDGSTPSYCERNANGESYVFVFKPECLVQLIRERQ
jgi:hypothetical protein